MVTSCYFDHHSFRVPLALVADPQLVTWQQTGVIILPTTEDEVGVMLSVDVIECNLHIVLSLTLLYLSIRLGLFSQQSLEDSFVLASGFVLQ